MTRAALLALLLCLGCSARQQTEQPPRRSWLPNTDLLTQDADTFFSRKNENPNPLPATANDTASRTAH